jgi:hypothetical protein
MKNSIYLIILTISLLLSCSEEDFQPATITFYPTLAASAQEPEEGEGVATTVRLKTSRVLNETSQVNIRIKGNGAGYGYSYVTNPPQLQPGIITLTIPEGENETSFTFAPVSDGISECTGYSYEFTIEGASKAIKSIGQGKFMMEVTDTTPGILDFDFEDCNPSLPTGVTEVKAAGETVMQANSWGCTTFGYPNDNTRAVEANAFGKGAGTSNAYLMFEPIDVTELNGFCISAVVYSRFTGAGQIKFLYSTTYSGTGNPEAEGVVWNEIPSMNQNLPAAGSRAWKAVNATLENIDGNTVYVAVQYKGGTTSSASNWRIDEFQVKGF